jgi:hypothetical protein
MMMATAVQVADDIPGTVGQFVQSEIVTSLTAGGSGEIYGFDELGVGEHGYLR